MEKLTDEERAVVDEKLKVLTNPKQETPIEELPQGLRFGTLIRRARISAGKSLRDIEEGLIDDGFTKVMIASVERGRLPLSWEQTEAFCHFVGVSTAAFESALVGFHREVWSDKEGGVKLREMVEQVTSLAPVYDQVELLTALRSAISTMDVVKGVLDRSMRIIRLCDGFERDTHMAAQGSLLLDATMSHAQSLLDNPPDPMPVPERKSEAPPDWEPPADWVDAERFEVGKVYQHRSGNLMHIIGEVETTGYFNPTLVAETQGGLTPVGADSDSAQNWRQVPMSTWLASWLPENDGDKTLRARYEAALKVEAEGESLAQKDDDEGIEKKSYVPRISLDFDGVVHSYQSGWAGDAKIIPDPPVPTAFGFIEEAIDRGYDVAIFSTRSHVPGATDAMRAWLTEHGMNEKVADLVKFPKKKPNAMLLIDDRGFHFKGTFPSWEYIDGFKPWNKGGERDDVEGTRYPSPSEKE